MQHMTADGRVFEFIGDEPYTRKTDGQPSRLLIWLGTCRQCGKPYRVKTPMSIHGTHAFGVVHCPEHRKGTKRTKWTDSVRFGPAVRDEKDEVSIDTVLSVPAHVPVRLVTVRLVTSGTIASEPRWTELHARDA